MDGVDHKVAFFEAVSIALDAQSFVKLSLGKPRGDTDLKKILITPVVVRDQPMLRTVSTHATKDITKNLTPEDALAEIGRRLGETFLSATLFATTGDVTISYNKRKEAHLTRSKPVFAVAAAKEHNRTKQYVVEPSRPYLHHLGITLDDGRVKPSMYPKFKQICHFIEIADDLVRGSELAGAADITAIDIGSGKGYLTFALHDYVTAHLKKGCRLSGIERRPDLVQFCNGLSARLNLKGLSFEAESAAQTRVALVDLLMALHACDTATDDAIAHGIAANAALIITAPCCQHEIAPQLSKPAKGLRGLTKFGLLKQRQADLVTDAARCLLLEASGYKVKVIEFVSTEHTAKNLMIAGIRSPDADRAGARRQYEELKDFAGFSTHHLERRLAELSSIPAA
jgi:Methyltransferase domain